MGWSFPLRSEEVLVTAVNGQVLFGPKNMLPMLPVRTGQRLGAGLFSCAGNGILYLSTFDGSELRLSESGTLRYDATDDLCRMERQNGKRSTFRLLKGKVQINIKFPTTPPHCYHVILPQAEAAVSHGQCVMCMHGGGTFLFVSHGNVVVTDREPTNPLQDLHTPIYGALPTTSPAAGPARTLTPIRADHSQIVVGNGQVGVIGIDGDLRVQPLSALSAATQSCLLAGFNPAVVAGGSGKKSSPDDSDVVSPSE